MTPERYARIKELFLAVCQVEESRRSSWLREACGDDEELHREVQRLLSHHTDPQTAALGVTEPQAAGTAVLVRQLDAGAPPPASPPPGPTRNFPPGWKLADRFRIVCLLGKGGMGEVYRAEDLVLGQNVSLKFLPAHLSRNPVWLERMRGEVALARRITHPHVCRVHDVNEVDGDVFVSMQYIDGEDLRSLLGRIERPPYEKALQLAREISLGLAAAHAQGIIHRDLKPANIMIDGLGHACITDFGLAALHHEIQQSDVSSGTPAYMAPEQLSGQEVTLKCDIYALGLVLYELLTGESPYRGRTIAEFAELRRSPPDVLPSSLIDQVDPQVERVVMRCLEPDPKDRPASAAVIAAALPGPTTLSTALLAGETLTPEMVALGDELELLRPARVSPRLSLFAALIAVLFVLSPWTHPLQLESLRDPPATMASRARDLATELGVADLRHEVYGLEDSAALPAVFASAGGSPTAETRLVFWYRGGPEVISADDAYGIVFRDGRANPGDPVDVMVGGVRLVTNARGQLRWFEHHVRSDPDHPSGRAADWSHVLRLAGVNADALQPDRPRARLNYPVDAQAAWLGRLGSQTDPVRIEAAQADGLITFFSVSPAQESPAAAHTRADLERRRDLRRGVQTGVIAALIALSVPLSRRNLRRGRGDVGGALRLSGFVFILRLIGWLLQTPLPTAFWPAWRLLVLGLTGALAEAGLVLLLYTALEPFARRFWPQTLISWSRILRGRIIDPRVGRDLLAGALLGAFLAVLFKVDFLIGATGSAGSRQPLRSAEYYQSLINTPMALAFVADAFRSSIYYALAFMLLIALLRGWTRSSTIAGVVSFLLMAPMFVPGGANRWLSPLLLGVGAAGATVVAFIRLGLLPLVSAFFLAIVLMRFPLTLDVSAWYSGLAILAILCVGIIAGGASYLARRPQTTAISTLTQTRTSFSQT